MHLPYFNLYSIIGRNFLLLRVKLEMPAMYSLQDELRLLRTEYKSLHSKPDGQSSEAKHFKDLYENEQKLRERLSLRLEKANEKASKAQVL